MTDLGTEKEQLDLTGDISWDVKLRALIDEVEYNGGDPGSVTVFTDFETHADIRNDLQDYTHYNDVGEKLGFGFRSLEFDNTPIMKTHGIDKQATATTSGDPIMIART